jgi:hypothetical protein
MRPGPDAIPPAAFPGGVVIHFYDMRGNLLCYVELGPGMAGSYGASLDPEQAAAVVAAQNETDGVIIVAYDGDTGMRLTSGMPVGLLASFKLCVGCGQPVQVDYDFPAEAEVVCARCALGG